VAIRARALQHSNGNIAAVKNVFQITFHPNQTLDIVENVDKELDYSTCSTTAMLHEVGDSILYPYVDVDTTVVGTLNIDEDNLLDDHQKILLKTLLHSHADIFSTDDTDICLCNFMKHRIDLANPTPFKQQNRVYHQPR